jgi:outer membrane protein OmpA-like peptidoglycan-associated protein
MRAFSVTVAAALALTGCAGTKVALYDGEESCFDTATQKTVQCPTGSVAVLNDETGGDIALIDQAYSRGNARATRASIKSVKPEVLRARYGKLFDTLPKPPRLFVFYFDTGSASLPPEAKPLVDEMLAEIKNRPGADVVIVGHTDRQGDGPFNDNVSIGRANALLEQLKSEGLDASIATTAGRGERDPIDRPDVDGLESAQNRRAEVFVR